MNISTPSISGVSNQLINAGNIQTGVCGNSFKYDSSVIKIGRNLDFTFTKNPKIIELAP